MLKRWDTKLITRNDKKIKADSSFSTPFDIGLKKHLLASIEGADNAIFLD